MPPTYRAWIKAEKRMVDVQVIDFRDNFIICLDPLNVYRGYYFDDIVLMLGTEIKDKFVYEGDIVKAYWTADSIHIHVGIIYFRNGAFRIGEKESHNAFAALEAYDDFEIIGNKFEHPHLLEEKDDR